MGRLNALNFFGLDPSVFRTDFSNLDVTDSNTLMIVAGPCGSGKSTLLRAAYKGKLLLFGLGFSQCFSKSCRDRSYREHDDYKVAWRKKSFSGQSCQVAGSRGFIASVCIAACGSLPGVARNRLLLLAPYS